MTSGLVVLAPLRVEARALRRGLVDTPVVRVGAGAARSAAAAAAMAAGAAGSASKGDSASKGGSMAKNRRRSATRRGDPGGVDPRGIPALAPTPVLAPMSTPAPAPGAAAATTSAAAGAVAMVVAGVAGGLLRGLAAGTVVVADRVLSEDGATVGVLPSAHWVAAEVERLGLPVRIGPVVSTRRVVRGTRNRAALADTGAIAVDTETAFVLAALGPADLQLPTAVVRVVVDTPDQELLSPATIFGGFRALRRLKAAAPALEAWTSLLQPRRALLAGPRSFCAGVDRAIATVETAIERFGAPLYVRRQIVHNTHVVADLESRGAVFVQELGEVPDGSTVVLAAHGVSPAVRAEAAGRDLKVIDATCPLVAKVHREARRFSERGFQTVLIGHAGHEEVEGTLGEDARITLLTEPADVDRLEVEDPSRLAYLSQTTLSQADVAAVVERLSQRFPEVTAPPATDICYATQNRQDALSAIAAECGLIVVVGSANSSNAARLVEVAERAGSRAVLVDDAAGLRPEWFAGVRAVGITAAASTPPHLVEEVVAALRGLGPVEVQERVVRTENINFPLPVEVR